VWRFGRREHAAGFFLLSPLVLVFLGGIFFAAAAPKHLIIVLPALAITLAVGVLHARPEWLGWAMLSLIVIASGVSDFNYFMGRQFADASMIIPWRQIAHEVKTDERPDEVVLLGWRTRGEAYGSDRALFERYYEGSLPVRYLSEDDWRERIRRSVTVGGAWLLLERGESRETIAAWLKAQGFHVTEHGFVREVETLRMIKEGGSPEQYRSYVLILYHVTPAAPAQKEPS
jgi:hypothetical protein